MSKTLKVMFSLVVAFVLVLGLSTTAFAYETYEPIPTGYPTPDPSWNPTPDPSWNPTPDPSYGPNYTPTPSSVIYYPNYNQVSEADEQEVPAATADAANPAPVSPKTGDNGMVVVVLIGAAVIATLGYVGVKALRA